MQWPSSDAQEAVGTSRALWGWDVCELPLTLSSQNGAASTELHSQALMEEFLNFSVYFSEQWLTQESYVCGKKFPFCFYKMESFICFEKQEKQE